MIRTWTAVVLVSASAVAFARLGQAQSQDPEIERGRYLTHDVAMCVQCHTPRTADGNLDETRLFQGAPIPVPRPPYPNQEWAPQAPAIAGLAGLSDADEMSVLMTGRRLSGEAPRPPMPPFRLSREDAAAIVSYLNSLRPR